MHYQSQHLTQQLLAPLNAVFQDVQKSLQMELDVERVLQTDVTEQQMPPASLADGSASSLTATARHIETTPTQASVKADSKSNTAIIDDAPTTISSDTGMFASSLSGLTLPLTPVDNSKIATNNNEIAANTSSLTVSHEAAITNSSTSSALHSTTVDKVKPAIIDKRAANETIPSALPNSAALNKPSSSLIVPEADNVKAMTTDNQVAGNTIPGKNSTIASSQFNTVVPLAPVEHNIPTTNDKQSEQASQSVNTNQSTAVTPITDASIIGQLSSKSSSLLPTETESANSFIKNLPQQPAKQQTASINSAAVLIPLRSQPTANITSAVTSQNSTPGFPPATTNRLEAAVEPALQQAYSITQQQLQNVNEDSANSQTSGLVRNTFNVSVAMNNYDHAKAVNLADFEQALTDVLLKAARRQGLEV